MPPAPAPAPHRRAIWPFLVCAVTVLAVAAVLVVYFAAAPAVVVPSGSYVLSGRDGYQTAFTFESSRTAAYAITGAWSASAPVQVIVAEVLGSNRAGCGFIPLNYPSGPPAAGCRPVFEASPEGSFDFAFHVCVMPNYLPTGSFTVVFRSNITATVTVTRSFAVQTSDFPQSSCP